MELTRKQFLSHGITGLAAAAALQGMAEADLVERKSQWNDAKFQKLLHYPARYRQLYDITQIDQGIFLNNIKNSLNGFHFGYGVPEAQVKITAALHGGANLLNFTDAMWKKYQLGAFLNLREGGAFAESNPYYPATHQPGHGDPNDEHSFFQDHSIEALTQRGVQFLCCHTATEEQSRKLIKKLGLTVKPEVVVEDLLAHLNPGVLVVPSMVATVAILQTDGKYSYATIA